MNALLAPFRSQLLTISTWPQEDRECIETLCDTPYQSRSAIVLGLARIYKHLIARTPGEDRGPITEIFSSIIQEIPPESTPGTLSPSDESSTSRSSDSSTPEYLASCLQDFINHNKKLLRLFGIRVVSDDQAHPSRIVDTIQIVAGHVWDELSDEERPILSFEDPLELTYEDACSIFSAAATASLVRLFDDGRNGAPLLFGTVKEKAQSLKIWLQGPEGVRLTAIDGSHLRLLCFPLEICALTRLESLCLSENLLQAVPSELGQLQALKVLDLSSNEISSLPGEIADLSRLTTLNVSDNLIKNLDLNFSGLDCLKVFDARSNRLTEVETTLFLLPSLSRVYFEGNDLLHGIEMPGAAYERMRRGDMQIDEEWTFERSGLLVRSPPA